MSKPRPKKIIGNERGARSIRPDASAETVNTIASKANPRTMGDKVPPLGEGPRGLAHSLVAPHAVIKPSPVGRGDRSAWPSRSLCSSHRWDVLVEPEEIRGIVCGLHSHQPCIFCWAVGCLDSTHIVLRLVIDIQATGRERLERPPELSDPADHLCIHRRVGPHPDNQKVVEYFSLINRRLVSTHTTNSTAEMLNDYMRVRGGDGAIVINQHLDGTVTQILQVVRLPVVAQAWRVEVLNDAL